MLSDHDWKQALSHAVPVTLAVLGLFAYWFAIANRSIVFLYGHLGAAPFDRITSSRYWMAGFVAAGAVQLVYTLFCWLRGRLAARRDSVYHPPVWKIVWWLCAGPLAAGLAGITLRLNVPVLPPHLAAACVFTTLAGLALALLPGRLAAQRPFELFWLELYGLGLALPLVLLRALELPPLGIVDRTTALTAALGALLAGAGWLTLLSLLHGRRRPVDAAALLAAGLSVGYLQLALLHYLFFTPPAYRYISSADNLMARSWRLQAATWVLTVLLAWGTTCGQRTLNRRGHSPADE